MTKLYFMLWLAAMAIALPIHSQVPNASDLDASFLELVDVPRPTAMKTQGTQASLPTLYYTFDWNTQTSSWDSLFRTEISYITNLGLDTSTITYQKFNGAWLDPTKFTKKYNSAGQVTELTNQYWDGSAWVLDDITGQTFDQNGLITERYYASTINGPLDTLSWLRYTNTYTSFNEPDSILRERYDFFGQTWNNSQITSFTYYPNEERSSVKLDTWSGSSWDPALRVVDYVWEDYPAGKYNERTTEEYLNGAWVPLRKEVYDWMPYESFEATTLEYDTTTQAFDSTRRALLVNNANGDQELYHNYLYANGWDLYLNSSNFINTYNGSNMLVERIEEFYDLGTGVFNNRFKDVFLNFSVGVEEEMPEGQAVWAPQPAGESVTLYLETKFRGAFEVWVMDLTGKPVRSYDLRQVTQGQRHDLDLGLARGMYLYRVEMRGNEWSGKLMVR